jgi:hypothetical protein
MGAGSTGQEVCKFFSLGQSRQGTAFCIPVEDLRVAPGKISSRGEAALASARAPADGGVELRYGWKSGQTYVYAVRVSLEVGKAALTMEGSSIYRRSTCSRFNRRVEAAQLRRSGSCGRAWLTGCARRAPWGGSVRAWACDQGLASGLGRAGMRGGIRPGPAQAPQQIKVIPHPAHERSEYVLESTSGMTASIAKTFELRSEESADGEPRLLMTGAGTITFDAKDGIPVDLEFKAMVEEDIQRQVLGALRVWAGRACAGDLAEHIKDKNFRLWREALELLTQIDPSQRTAEALIDRMPDDVGHASGCSVSLARSPSGPCWRLFRTEPTSEYALSWAECSKRSEPKPASAFSSKPPAAPARESWPARPMMLSGPFRNANEVGSRNEPSNPAGERPPPIGPIRPIQPIGPMRGGRSFSSKRNGQSPDAP